MKKNILERYNIYVTYSVLFLLILLIGLIPIEIRNGRLFFSGVFVHLDTWLDGLKQHIFFMYDYVKEIKDFLFLGESIDMYQYDIGMGESFIGAYTYYGLFDPLIVIPLILPLEYIEVAFYLMITMRLFLTGIFMILLLKYIGIKKNSHILLGTLFYVFSYTTLFSAFRHPFFTTGVMYMPLAFLGLLRVYDKKSPLLFIVAIFLSVISQFYMAIYILFGVEMFILVKSIKDKDYKNFILINIYLGLGLLLSSIVLLPQVYSVLGGSRVSSKGFRVFDPLYYGFLLFSTLLPIGSVDFYTITIQNIFIVVIAFLYMYKNKFKDIYSIIIIALVVMVLIPFFGYAFSLFSYVNNRWTFIIEFYITIMFVKYLNEHQVITKKDTNIILKLVLSFFVLGAMFMMISPIHRYIRNMEWLVVLLEVLVFVVGYFVIKKFILPIKLSYKEIKIRSFRYLYLGFIVFTLFSVSILYLFMLSGSDAFTTYYEEGKIEFHDDSFYRVEQNVYEVGIRSFSNDGIFYEYPSTSLYNTMNNGYVVRSLDFFDVLNENNTVGYNGLDNRFGLLKANYVKYIMVRESESVMIPYGYEEIDRIKVKAYDTSLPVSSGTERFLMENGEYVYEDLIIYEDTNPYQFGLLYEDYVVVSDLENMSGLEREFILNEYLILEEEIDQLQTSTYSTNINKYPIDITNFNTEEDIEISIDVVEDGYVYLNIDNITHSDKYQKYIINVLSETVDKRVVYYPYGGNMHTGDLTHTINLGYYEAGTLDFVLNCNKNIDFSVEEISYSIIPHLELEKFNDLDDNVLSNVAFKNGGFTASIDDSKSGLLYLPIVYNRGFKVFIDGEEQELLLANEGMSAVYIENNSSIELVYETPGLQLGMYVSILSAIAVIGLSGYFLFRKERNNEES